MTKAEQKHQATLKRQEAKRVREAALEKAHRTALREASDRAATVYARKFYAAGVVDSLTEVVRLLRMQSDRVPEIRKQCVDSRSSEEMYEDVFASSFLAFASMYTNRSKTPRPQPVDVAAVTARIGRVCEEIASIAEEIKKVPTNEA